MDFDMNSAKSNKKFGKLKDRKNIKKKRYPPLKTPP